MYQKASFVFFEKTQKRTSDNFHTAILEVIEHATGRAFLAREDDESLNDKFYKLSKTQHATGELVHHLIKSFPFTVPVTHFVKQQA